MTYRKTSFLGYKDKILDNSDIISQTSLINAQNRAEVRRSQINKPSMMKNFKSRSILMNSWRENSNVLNDSRNS